MFLDGAQRRPRPRRIPAEARAHDRVRDDRQVGDAFEITKIELDCEAVVPNIDEARFQEQAKAAKEGCPVSKALKATKIELRARLVK